MGEVNGMDKSQKSRFMASVTDRMKTDSGISGTRKIGTNHPNPDEWKSPECAYKTLVRGDCAKDPIYVVEGGDIPGDVVLPSCYDHLGRVVANALIWSPEVTVSRLAHTHDSRGFYANCPACGTGSIAG